MPLSVSILYGPVPILSLGRAARAEGWKMLHPRHQPDATDAIGRALRPAIEKVTQNDRGHRGSDDHGWARIHRLLADEAWTEAGLALIEVGLPQWTLRRIVRDDGEWLCTLST